MIAKISSSQNLGGALGYNFKKVRSQEASVLMVNNLETSEEDYDLNSVMQDMLHCIPSVHRTKNIVFHCSLNPHPDEKLSNDQLKVLAEEYMKEMGYEHQPYIVFKHNDISREHIHIVSLRVDSHGKKVSDKFEGRKSKRITDRLNQKYNLLTHEKSISSSELNPVQTHSGNIKKDIEKVIRGVLSHYRFSSLGELNAILSKYNLAVDEAKKEYRGKQYNGLVYTPTDENGNKISTPLDATKIGHGVGYYAIHTHMKKSKKEISKYLPEIRKSVLKIMRSSPKNEQELIDKLKAIQLRCIIRKNEQGRIYGITFIDDNKGIAVNGSRLGKGYAANKFHEYFLNPKINSFKNEELYGLDKANKNNELSLSHLIEVQENKYEEDAIVDKIIDELFSTSYDDSAFKEKAWQKKLRNQHKLKFKRRK